MQVVILTKRNDIPDGEGPIPECKLIDWKKSSDRKWFMNHMHWSMLHGRIVTVASTAPAID